MPFPSEEEISDCLAELWALLYLSEYDEREMPPAVFALHTRLNDDQELYLEVWGRLDSKTRASWKGWLDDYRRQGRESRGIPPRYLREVWEGEGPCGVLFGESAPSEVNADAPGEGRKSRR